MENQTVENLDVVTIANAYHAALTIINKACCDTVRVDTLWQKVRRIQKYLENQAKAELSETLN